jgi:UDP-N-acetyl-D-mannosaminuronate dehydrogenase
MNALFVHKPDFILPAVFFVGNEIDVCRQYCREVPDKGFRIRSNARQADIELFDIILIAPAHCGFKECVGAVRTNTIVDFRFAVRALLQELRAAHCLAAHVYHQGD